MIGISESILVVFLLQFSGILSQRHSRTYSPAENLPNDVAVGALEIGSQRLLYTYFNSTTLSGGLALVGGATLLFVIFLYFYDIAENGTKRKDSGDSINDFNFDYNDPYGYIDMTTRIRRYVDPYCSRQFISSVHIKISLKQLRPLYDQIFL